MDLFTDEADITTPAILSTTAGALVSQEATQGNTAEPLENHADSETLQYRPTNIPYFDEHIKNGTLTPYDAYLARKFLNIDLTMNANINMDAKVKSLSGNQAYKDIKQTLEGLEVGDQVIQDAGEKAGGIVFKHDNAGFFGGLNRKLNEATGGIWGLGDDASAFHAKSNSLVYSIARAQGKGKTTNEQINDAKNIYAPSFRSPAEYRSKIAQAQEIQLAYLQEQIQDLIARGYEPTQHMIEQYNKHKAKIDYIRSGKQFDKATYNSIGNTAQEWLQQQKEGK